MTQEEYNAIITENQIAQDNLAKIDNELARYTEAARIYANATPEQQEQLKGTMAQVLQQYNQLKAQRDAAANRIVNATNQLEGANALLAQQQQQQAIVNGGGQKRRVVVPGNEVIVPETVVPSVVIPSTTNTNPYLNLYSQYAQMKGDKTGGLNRAGQSDYKEYFTSNWGTPTVNAISTARENLSGAGLDNAQIHDFVSDWLNSVYDKRINGNPSVGGVNYKPIPNTNASVPFSNYTRQANGNKISPDGTATIYPNGSIQFGRG